MLLDRVSATQSFSDLDTSEDSYAPAPPSTDRRRRPATGPGRTGPHPSGGAGAIAEGDQVVFARLDLAEALGIWRHARGRVIEIHPGAQVAPETAITVDVKFEGHELLHAYLPDLFAKQAD